MVKLGNQRSMLPDDHERAAAPLGGTHAQNVQRLQVGLSGIAAMILLVGLASIVIDQARLTEETVATIEGEPVIDPAEETPAAPSDPLADIGVVPDLPAETPAPEATNSTGQSPSGNVTTQQDGADAQ